MIRDIHSGFGFFSNTNPDPGLGVKKASDSGSATLELCIFLLSDILLLIVANGWMCTQVVHHGAVRLATRAVGAAATARVAAALCAQLAAVAAGEGVVEAPTRYTHTRRYN